MVIWAYAAILAWSVAVPASATSVAPVPSMAPAVPVAPAVSPMPRPEQVMAVPPELRAQLQQQVIDASGFGRSRLERLVGFLFQKPGLGMTYSTDATLTVEQAYRTRKANCLTFTLLTVALARESGLQAYGQELDGIVAWRVGGDIVYRFNHVNAGVGIGRARFTVDVAQDLVGRVTRPSGFPTSVCWRSTTTTAPSSCLPTRPRPRQPLRTWPWRCNWHRARPVPGPTPACCACARATGRRPSVTT
jgi:hypothetical protein